MEARSEKFGLGIAALTALVVLGSALPAGASSGTSGKTQLQSGYSKDERFCSENGTIDYRVTHHTALVTVKLHSLVPKKQYSLDWQNNGVRGYTIGVFETASDGSVAPGSLRLFRPAETQGIGVMVYYLSGFDSEAVVRFKPC